MARRVAGTWSRSSTDENTSASSSRALESDSSEGVEAAEASSHDFSFCRATSTIRTRMLDLVGTLLERTGKEQAGDDEKTSIETELNFNVTADVEIYSV